MFFFFKNCLVSVTKAFSFVQTGCHQGVKIPTSFLIFLGPLHTFFSVMANDNNSIPILIFHPKFQYSFQSAPGQTLVVSLCMFWVRLSLSGISLCGPEDVATVDVHAAKDLDLGSGHSYLVVRWGLPHIFCIPWF